MNKLIKDLKSGEYIEQKPFNYIIEAKNSACIMADARSKHILIELGYYFLEREIKLCQSTK
jgi:hypothetical protein